MHQFPSHHPLHHAVFEFWLADGAYQKMKDISLPIAEHELSWREALHRIERIYTKTKAAASSEPGWAKINSWVSHLRHKDPLLRYVRQARDAEEHSVQTVARDWEPIESIKGNGKGSIVLTVRPWDRSLPPIENRGVTYDPPRTHLGNDFSHLLGKGQEESVVVAGLALGFYCDFINRVSADLYPHIGPQP